MNRRVREVLSIAPKHRAAFRYVADIVPSGLAAVNDPADIRGKLINRSFSDKTVNDKTVDRFFKPVTVLYSV